MPGSESREPRPADGAFLDTFGLGGSSQLQVIPSCYGPWVYIVNVPQLLVNMTAGMTFDAIPKAIRKFRIPPAISHDKRDSLPEHDFGILVNIVSGGCTRDDLVSGSLDMTWSVWYVDVRPFEDPNHDPNLRAHVGRHVEIVKGLLRNEYGEAHEGFDFLGVSHSSQQEERD